MPRVCGVGLFKGGLLHRLNGRRHLQPFPTEGLGWRQAPSLYPSDSLGTAGQAEKGADPKGLEGLSRKNAFPPEESVHLPLKRDIPREPTAL